MPEVMTAPRARRWVRASPGAILCFHGLTDATHPAASGTHVPLETLTGAVAAARRIGEIVPLGELVARSRAGRSTAGLIALTFDDAYLSLRAVAGEFLRRQSVPITVFVATDAAATGATFWWDRTEEVFLRCAADRWAQFEAECGIPRAFLEGQPPEFGRLRPLRQWILSEYQGRWPEELEPVLARLEEEVGVPPAGVHRSMTFAELDAWRREGGVDLAVHTRSHPVLPLLPRDVQVDEIAGSHAVLRERFGEVLPVLAIPFGLYDASTASIATEAGMEASLTLAASTLRSGIRSDCLPRFCITRGESLLKLHLRMMGVADGVRRLRGEPVEAYPLLPSPTS